MQNFTGPGPLVTELWCDIGLFDGNFNRMRNNNTSVGINIIYSWRFGYFITIFRRLNLIINIKHDLWEKYTQFIEFLHDEIQNFSKNEQNFMKTIFLFEQNEQNFGENEKTTEEQPHTWLNSVLANQWVSEPQYCTHLYWAWFSWCVGFPESLDCNLPLPCLSQWISLCW